VAANGIVTTYGSEKTFIVRNNFNRDGKPDILWRNKTTDDLALWYLNGVNLVSSVIEYIKAYRWFGRAGQNRLKLVKPFFLKA
jgi:hypothetical protein